MTYVRVSLVIWLIVAGAVALGLYQVKYEVQRLEEKLHEVRSDIRQDRVALHVLEAEWAYLNRPERLQRLASKYLDMGPSGARQVAAVTALPPRISDPEQAMRYAKVGGGDSGGGEALPLPQAKPWSLEQPIYARAEGQRAQPGSRRNDGPRTPLRRARAQVAEHAAAEHAAAERAAAGSQPAVASAQNTGANDNTRATKNNTAGQVGQSDGSKGPAAKSSPPRASPPKSRQIAVGDVLIQVGVRQ